MQLQIPVFTGMWCVVWWCFGVRLYEIERNAGFINSHAENLTEHEKKNPPPGMDCVIAIVACKIDLLCDPPSDSHIHSVLSKQKPQVRGNEFKRQQSSTGTGTGDRGGPRFMGNTNSSNQRLITPPPVQYNQSHQHAPKLIDHWKSLEHVMWWA